MKTSGAAKQVSIFQPYGIGKREINDCQVELKDGRVEITTSKPVRDINPYTGTYFNFPAEICTIVWGD